MKNIKFRLTEFHDPSGRIEGFAYELSHGFCRAGINEDLDHVMEVLQSAIDREYRPKVTIISDPGVHDEELCNAGSCPKDLKPEWHQRYSRAPSGATLEDLSNFLSGYSSLDFTSH